MRNAAQIFHDDAWIEQTRRMLDSYQRLTKRSLIDRTTAAEDSATLFNIGFVVVAHGTEDDPLLNYANAAALALWELPLQRIIGMPSRETAEPVHRSERAELLRRTRQHGFIDDYTGVRIASDGRRFRIQQATVWNITDDDGTHCGQAATFSEWTYLDRRQ